MSPSTWRRVKALYLDARDAPESERQDFVEQAAADSRTKSEVLRMLRSEGEPAAVVRPIRLTDALAHGPTRLVPGQELAGRYYVRRFVAAGGFGEVYEAEDREAGERIALKIFRQELASSDQVAWLRREVQMARKVRHPNVCRVFDIASSGAFVFLTMEFLEGETLAAHLARHGALTERAALPLIRQIVAGLQAAHEQGVVHRDLKPGNIMIVPRPDGPPRAVITDFGLARTGQDPRRSTVTMHSAAAFGTPAYMAPEQVAGLPAGRPADIYSLGVVLYEMLTGELPFAGESPLTMAVRKTSERAVSPRRFAPSIRPNWERTIGKCLEPKPSNRFSGAAEVLLALETRSWWKSRARLGVRTLRTTARRMGRTPALVAAAAVLGVAAWIAAPRPPSPDVEKAWRQGVVNLHAGEPVEALKVWDKVRGQRLPTRAAADEALAWHRLGFPDRAERALAGFSSWRASAGDRSLARAVRQLLGGDVDGARKELLARISEPPQDPDAMADAAALAAPELWPRVAEVRPGNGAAQLHLAEQAAQVGMHDEAERRYLLASAYFQAAGETAMVRAVSARRALRLIEAGDAEAAQREILPGQKVPAGTAPCERFVVMMAGEDDRFAAPPDPIPYLSPRFEQVPARGALPALGFDETTEDRLMVVSFPLPPVRFCSAQIQMRMRRSPTVAGAANDGITVGAAPFDNPANPPVFTNLWAAHGNDAEVEVTMELKPDLLAGIQRAYAGEAVASLDISASDDTDFDYIRLTLVY